MGSVIFIYIASLASIFGSLSAYSISFRRPCRDMSPECLKQSLQKALPAFANGIPELGIEALDPYILKELSLNLPGGIDIAFSHGYAKGLKKCIVDFARYDEDTFEAQLHCNLTIKGKYKSSGRLLVFPIDGDGESTIKCNNIKLHAVLKLGTQVKTDGQSYLYVKSSTFDHSYDGRVSYSMTNLFKGSPEISNAVLEFMNSNWRMVAEEFGTPMVDYGVNSVLKNIRRLFEVVPIDELKKL
ncbi:circadian clock-controlled protein daywake [Helicoverpa armigera]|uniref:circadian clock-controlled protein daywake n=1 Tax=Helicoverpa armigera TaxID=29058 RepID=UPI00308274E8